MLQYRLAISSPASLKPSCAMTQFPTRRSCCHRSRGSQGKETLAHLCRVRNNHSTSKADSFSPLASPELASHLPPPLAGCAVLGWRDLPPASPGLWRLAHFLPWMTRLPEVGCSAGWDLSVTTNLPDLQFKVCDSKTRSWSFTSAPQTAQREMKSFYFPSPVNSKHVTWKIWVPILVGLRETCYYWKFQKPSGSFWWAQQQCLL